MTYSERMKLVGGLTQQIEVAYAPGKMTKPEALEFIEEIISQLEARCEALREEIQAEGEEVEP